MSRLDQITDLLKQLADDGAPEPVSLLSVARRAIDQASEALARMPDAAIVRLYRRLGTISRDIVVMRDAVDDRLAALDGRRP